MNRKVKNMVENMHDLQHNDVPVSKNLLQKGTDLLKDVNFKNPKAKWVAAGTAGLIGAAGLAYYFTRKNKFA